MVGKRLSSEFEQLAGVASTPSTGSPSIAAESLPPPLQQPGAVLGVGYHHVPQPPPDPPDNLQLPTPHISQSFGQVTGISSGSNHNFSLSSSPQSLLGSTSGPVGWSEARPVMGNRWEDMTLLPSSGLQIGSSSGYPHFLALSPSPQSSIGFVPSYQTPPQPPSPSGWKPRILLSLYAVWCCLHHQPGVMKQYDQSSLLKLSFYCK